MPFLYLGGKAYSSGAKGPPATSLGWGCEGGWEEGGELGFLHEGVRHASCCCDWSSSNLSCIMTAQPPQGSLSMLDGLAVWSPAAVMVCVCVCVLNPSLPPPIQWTLDTTRPGTSRTRVGGLLRTFLLRGPRQRLFIAPCACELAQGHHPQAPSGGLSGRPQHTSHDTSRSQSRIRDDAAGACSWLLVAGPG